MKKILALVLSLIMMLSISAMAEETAPALQKDIVILFTSDVHCGIDQGFTYTGLYGIKQQLAKDNYVVLADNGDSIQGEAIGALTKGEIDIIHDDIDYVVFDARSMSSKAEKQKRAFIAAGFEVDESYAETEDLILVLKRVG